jgi:hypothetical protein
MLTRELCTTTGWFNTVLISSIPPPPSSVLMVELLSLDSWYFGLCPGLGVSSSLPSTLFYFFAFALLCNGLMFVLAYVCVTHCHWPNQQEMICQLFFARSLSHQLLLLTCSGWGCHSGCHPHQVMGPRWTNHALSSLKSGFVHVKPAPTFFPCCQTSSVIWWSAIYNNPYDKLVRHVGDNGEAKATLVYKSYN